MPSMELTVASKNGEGAAQLNPRPSRRTFVKGLAAAAAASAGWLPRGASAQTRDRQPTTELSGTSFDLQIGETAVNITGEPRQALALHNSLPPPTPPRRR